MCWERDRMGIRLYKQEQGGDYYVISLCPVAHISIVLYRETPRRVALSLTHSQYYSFKENCLHAPLASLRVPLQLLEGDVSQCTPKTRGATINASRIGRGWYVPQLIQWIPLCPHPCVRILQLPQLGHNLEPHSLPPGEIQPVMTRKITQWSKYM